MRCSINSMNTLLKKINSIPRRYFTFADIRKVAGMSDESAQVSLCRMVKAGDLTRIARGVYTDDITAVDWEELAEHIYAPSYLSFEWVLARYGVLSQQPMALTLATKKRARVIDSPYKTIIYHHLQAKLYWGYTQENKALIAEPEKALLDLAYISLNGYGSWAPDEMDLSSLDTQKIARYLKKMNDNRLTRLIGKMIKGV